MKGTGTHTKKLKANQPDGIEMRKGRGKGDFGEITTDDRFYSQKEGVVAKKMYFVVFLVFDD